MSLRRPGGERVTEDGMGREDRRRSEAGDTLVEIPISLAVIGIAGQRSCWPSRRPFRLRSAPQPRDDGHHVEDGVRGGLRCHLTTASFDICWMLGGVPDQPGSPALHGERGNDPAAERRIRRHHFRGVLLEHHEQPAQSCCCADRHMPHWSNRRGAAVADGLRAVQARWRRHAAASHDHECCRQPELGDGGVDLWYAGSTALVEQPGNGNAGTALFPQPTLVIEDASNCIEKLDASSVKLSVGRARGR